MVLGAGGHIFMNIVCIIALWFVSNPGSHLPYSKLTNTRTPQSQSWQHPVWSSPSRVTASYPTPAGSLASQMKDSLEMRCSSSGVLQLLLLARSYPREWPSPLSFLQQVFLRQQLTASFVSDASFSLRRIFRLRDGVWEG